jgi:hypothetical protein
MGQFVVVGAVVDADLPELLLWTIFTMLVGLLTLYSGLCHDRLEYLTLLPALAAGRHRRVIGAQCALLVITVGLIVCSTLVFHEAGVSALLLLFFQCIIMLVEVGSALIQCQLQHLSRSHVYDGASDALYYAALLPELGVQLARLCHHLHVWCDAAKCIFHRAKWPFA